MNFKEIALVNIIPQREPFIAIGCLSDVDDRVTTSETLIEADSFFVEDGFFTSAGLIENIAQTCAARIGYINKYIKKKKIKVGFIGAIRNLTVERLPEVGELIHTRIEVLEEVFGLLLVKAEISVENERIVFAEMKIAGAD